MRGSAPLRLAVLALLAALPAGAQEALGAAEFEAVVEGRTLTWGFKGEAPYGIERYYPDRRVTWFRTDTRECLEGEWHAQGSPDAPAICFLYEDDPKAHCFRVTLSGGTLLAAEAGGFDAIQSELGAEHKFEFGCEFLGA